MSPIRTIAPRYPRLGSISVGYQDFKKKGGGVVTFPRRTDTLCFHSTDESRLEVIREAYGGALALSPSSTPDNEKFTLISEARSIPIHLPPTDDIERIAPQYMERWSASGLQCRCDGISCIAHRLPPKGDEKVGELSHEIVACICEAEGLDAKDRCSPIVRLAVILADLWQDIRGVGVWSVRSGGWGTNSNLAGELELYVGMLQRLGGAARFLLTVEMVRSRHGEVPTMHLELDHTPREAATLAAGTPVIDSPALPAALDEPVGTFTADGEDVSGVESSPGAPSAPDTSGSAFELLTVGSLAVPRVGGKTGAQSGARVTPAQGTILKRLADEVGWSPHDLLTAFEHFAGHPMTETSVQTAQDFGKWLRTAAKESA